MIAFPMRPYSPQTRTPQTDTCTSAGERPHYILATSAQRESATPAMSTSVLPPQRQSLPKRPKLSLQTATLPQPFAPKSANALSISHTNDSPTLRNTYSNALRAPNSANPSSALKVENLAVHSKPKDVSSPQATSASSVSSSETSPAVPYYLPIGARSILRNSPLPPRLVSATSARAPRRMFPPIKRVIFHENLVEQIPTPIVEESEPSDIDSDSSTSSRKRGRTSSRGEADEPEEPEDMPATPVQGRWKRKREWVWTLGPVEDRCVSPDAGPLLRKESRGISEEETERIAEARPKFREPPTAVVSNEPPGDQAHDQTSPGEIGQRPGLLIEIPHRTAPEERGIQ